MVSESKALLRKEMLAKRNSLSETELQSRSKEIEGKLFSLKEFQTAKTIAFYVSKGSEVQTLDAIHRAIEFGKEVLIPVTVNEHELNFVKFTSKDDLVPGKFNIPEPKTKTKHQEKIDLVVVPGIAFDSDLHRLGYGKGYYDKFFEKTKTFKVGLAFDFQVVPVLPRHEHDQQLDLIITDKRVVKK